MQHGVKDVFSHVVAEGEGRRLMEREADVTGVVLLLMSPELSPALQDYALPLVEVMTVHEGFDPSVSDGVFPDNEQGAYDAVNYLISMGHKKICFLAASDNVEGGGRVFLGEQLERLDRQTDSFDPD